MEETMTLMTRLGQFIGDKLDTLAQRLDSLEGAKAEGGASGSFDDMLASYNQAVGGADSPLYDDGSDYADT